MRADARRNRERLVAAAVDLFVEQGVEVPLDTIARRAGVGIGTLYRRFPDRDALVEAVAIETFTSVRDHAAEVAGDPGGRDLERFLFGVAERRVGVLMAGLLPALAELDDTRLTLAFDEVVEAVDALLATARDAGELRGDVTPHDVLTLLGLLTRPLDGAPEEYLEAMTPRLLHLVLDGLRPRTDAVALPPSPPPPAPGDRR
jgi:AcrR family transcriptional regulator